MTTRAPGPGPGPTGLVVDAFRASQPGSLPADGRADVGGVRVSAGRALRPQRPMGDPSSPAVIWVTDAVIEDPGPQWAALRAQFPRTGLWPLVLGDVPSGVPDLPSDSWDPEEIGGRSEKDPAGVDLAATFSRWWSENVESIDENGDLAQPFGASFPGLAPLPTGAVHEDAVDRLAARLRGRIALVAVTRPADVIAAIGWDGPANYQEDPGEISAVLRSWEDRYGAEIVGLGSDTITLAVRRPPTTVTESLGAGAEHLAVCPDNIVQGIDPLSRYAAALRDRLSWEFWWD